MHIQLCRQSLEASPARSMPKPCSWHMQPKPHLLMKGGKGSGKAGGQKGGKVPPSNLSIADRKAKLAELKARSRCLRCGAICHWAGDAECRFKGGPAGSKSGSGKGGPGAEKGATPGKSGAATSSQAYLAALSDTSDDEAPATHLSNTAEGMEGYPAERSGGAPMRPHTSKSQGCSR